MDIHHVSGVNKPSIHLRDKQAGNRGGFFKEWQINFYKKNMLLAIDWILILEKLVLIVIVVMASLLIAMYTTFAERKIAAVLQDRRGPNRAGPFGSFLTGS